MSKKVIIIVFLYCFLLLLITGCSKSNTPTGDNSTTTTSEDESSEDYTYENEVVNTDIYDWGVLLPEERYMKLDIMFALLSSTGVDSTLFPTYEDALLLIEEQLELNIKQTNIFDCLCIGIGVNPAPYHPTIDEIGN